MLTKESLLSGRRVRPVDVPGIGTAHVKELTAAEVVEFAKRQKDGPGGADDAVYFMLSRGVSDEAGRRLFADADDQVKELGHDTARTLAKAIADISGLNEKSDPSTSSGQAEAEAKKNTSRPSASSATTPAGASPSASA